MLPIHRRMAELWMKKSKSELTDTEYDELIMCLNANANYAWKLAKLENISYVAYSTNDTDWLHEICKEIEKLESELNTCFKQFKK